MTPDDRARYLAAYEAAYPGDLEDRDEDELDAIAKEMREVERAPDLSAAVSLLESYWYGGDLVEAARAMRASLGIEDPPEPQTAADLAARLREVERERDEARAERDDALAREGTAADERDRFRAMLDAERGAWGPPGWYWADGQWNRQDDVHLWVVERDPCPYEDDEPLPTTWTVHVVRWADEPRRVRVLGTHDTALEAMEAADAAKEEG